MTIEIKIPANALALQYHIGQALQAAAKAEGFEAPVTVTAVTKTVGDLSIKTEYGASVTTKEVDALEHEQVAADIRDREQGGELNNEMDAVDNSDPVAVDDDIAPDDDGTVTITPDMPDADGIVWDKRIHSQGQTRNADDTWRLARKPKDKTDQEWADYVEAVKAEQLSAASAVVPSDKTKTAIEEAATIEASFSAMQADPLPPVIDDPVPPTEQQADPLPPVIDEPVPPVIEPPVEADPLPPVTTPAPAAADKPVTFIDVVRLTTSKWTPADKPKLDEVIQAVADELGMTVANPKAPIMAFNKAPSDVLSYLTTKLEALL